MQGFPKTIGTKQDILNLVDVARQDESMKDIFIKTLDNLIATKQHRVLKAESMEKPAEEQTPDDYELIDDPNSQMARLGLNEEEINQLKESL